jgi:hypothetical protein
VYYACQYLPTNLSISILTIILYMLLTTTGVCRSRDINTVSLPRYVFMNVFCWVPFVEHITGCCHFGNLLANHQIFNVLFANKTKHYLLDRMFFMFVCWSRLRIYLETTITTINALAQVGARQHANVRPITVHMRIAIATVWWAIKTIKPDRLSRNVTNMTRCICEAVTFYCETSPLPYSQMGKSRTSDFANVSFVITIYVGHYMLTYVVQD